MGRSLSVACLAILGNPLGKCVWARHFPRRRTGHQGFDQVARGLPRGMPRQSATGYSPSGSGPGSVIFRHRFGIAPETAKICHSRLTSINAFFPTATTVSRHLPQKLIGETDSSCPEDQSGAKKKGKMGGSPREVVIIFIFR